MPELSAIVLAWDQIHLTERCVDSIRQGTEDVDYEVIVVDNGSEAATAQRAAALADKAVLNESNLGFAAGMNAGLAVAESEFVAFINNDTVLPPGWAKTLLATFGDHPQAGIVAPAVTAAGNPVTVRSEPGSKRVTLTPFAELPSGVLYVMPTATIRDLGGWNESYPVATAEDIDLCFTVWANDLDFVVDERVLVLHESQGTLSTKIDQPWQLLKDNLDRFLDRWTSIAPDVSRLSSCPPEIHDRNLASARAAAIWMRRYIQARDRAGQLGRERDELRDRRDLGFLRRVMSRR